MKTKSSEPEEFLDQQLRSNIEWPRTYQIVVEGRIEANWSDVLAGMRITPHSGDRSTESTVLMGLIRDEAELSGVLNTLYDLQLSLLSVELVRN